MLMTVEGIYENGRIELLEPLPVDHRVRVVVTVLPEPERETSMLTPAPRLVGCFAEAVPAEGDPVLDALAELRRERAAGVDRLEHELGAEDDPL